MVFATVISCNNSYNAIQYNVYRNFTFHTFGAPTDTGVIHSNMLFNNKNNIKVLK
jgi:hypothetical protein